MRKFLRQAALSTLKSFGVSNFTKNSNWRRERLLILCYHGIAIEDENEWRPALYVTQKHLKNRFELLKRGHYTVLSLSEGLERLYRKDLPPRSVAITFDDGTYDFYKQAYPLLREFGFPVTVYLTTYYSEFLRPVFNLICSYMLWKVRDRGPVDLSEFELGKSIELGSSEACQSVADKLVQSVEKQQITGAQKDVIAARLAARLDIDYQALSAKRILQLMNRQEVKQLADAGVDIQLHTHRHRTPADEKLFRREIADNRAWILGATGRAVEHFCYPSGVYRPEFFPWLSAEHVVSATTCETGLATAQDNPLLLPRYIDTSGRSDLEFESWLTGVGAFIPSRHRARTNHTD
jgi:peptidoglycan/xylan/chitin deacetylase (PgdA/CDA1 family)